MDKGEEEQNSFTFIHYFICRELFYMGLHRHVRIVINGKKIHSSGGTARDLVFSSILMNEFKHSWKIDNGLVDSEYINDEDVYSVRYIFIKRHRCHKNRTVEKIIEFSIFHSHVTCIYNIENPFIDDVYRDGTEIPHTFRCSDHTYLNSINTMHLNEILNRKMRILGDAKKRWDMIEQMHSGNMVYDDSH